MYVCVCGCVCVQEALKARVETIREKREARFEAAAAAARPAGATDGAGAGDEPTLAAGGTASEARAYFMARAADQDKSKAQPNDSYHKSDDPDSKHGTQGTHDKKQDTTGDPNEGDMDEDTEGWLRGVMTLMDIQEADERFRLLHGAAVAAGAVADAASPLLVSQDLRVSLCHTHTHTHTHTCIVRSHSSQAGLVCSLVTTYGPSCVCVCVCVCVS